MATPNIVPRAAGEGGLGTAAKGGATLTAWDSTASSATQGGVLKLVSDDGAVMADNHRLGVIEFKGAEDTSSTQSIGARIQAICRDAWDGSNNDADLQFYTTDGTTESAVLTLDADNLATFGGSVSIDNIAISAVQSSGESFADNDTSIMTSAAIDDRIAAAGGGISHDGSTANGVLTYKDADEATVEPNLTFDGGTLSIEADALTGAAALFIDANSLTSGYGISLDVDDALTNTTAHKKLISVDYDKGGATGDGYVNTTTGLIVNMADSTTNHANGTVTMTGAQIDIDSANAQGTLNQKGLILNVAADGVGDAATTSGIEMEVMDGGNDIKMMSHADTADYCTIGVTTNGATTITTVDGGAAAANFEVAADGDITLDAAGNIVLETGTTSVNSTSIPLRKFAPTGDNTAGNYNGGDVVYFGGTTSMTAGAIYHYKSDGTWELADANAVATSDGMLAVALGAASDTNGMLLRGMVTIDHDPGAIGDVLFLSTTAGDCSATAPTGSADIVRVVGYQVNHASNGEIWFCPDGTYVELA
jgi:hypothetical protein